MPQRQLWRPTMLATLADYTTAFRVDQTPDEAFAAIVNPTAWWGREIAGSAAVPGGEWSYRYKDLHYSLHRNVELVPGRKVVWHVAESRLNFVQDKSEWTGTDLVF